MKTAIVPLVMMSTLGITSILWASPAEKLPEAKKSTVVKVVRKSATQDKAYQTISSSWFFAIGGIGYGGEISDVEIAFHTLLQEKKPDSFVRLLQEKNKVAHLYGLLGLRYLNAPQYRHWVARCAETSGTVSIQVGCNRHQENFSDKVREIDKGSIDQTLKERFAHRVLATADYFAIGTIGFSGQISEGEKAMHAVLLNQDGMISLILMHSQNHATRLYALAALRYRNHPDCKLIARSLLQSKAKVQTMRGCVRNSERVADVARRILKGDFNTVLTFDKQRLERQEKAKKV